MVSFLLSYIILKYRVTCPEADLSSPMHWSLLDFRLLTQATHASDTNCPEEIEMLHPEITSVAQAT